MNPTLKVGPQITITRCPGESRSGARDNRPTGAIQTCHSHDVAAHLIPAPATLVQQLTHYSLGLVLFAFFDALYLGARFGSGPRDGLMTGAIRVTDQPLWKVRTSIEVIVVAIGWVLGGTVGAGTLILALAAGPLVQAFLHHTTVPLRIDNPPASTAH